MKILKKISGNLKIKNRFPGWSFLDLTQVGLFPDLSYSHTVIIKMGFIFVKHLNCITGIIFRFTAIYLMIMILNRIRKFKYIEAYWYFLRPAILDTSHRQPNYFV